MDLNRIQMELQKSSYDFTRQLILDGRLCFLTVGGSVAYGTDIETSDIDIRGCAVGAASDLLLGKDFEQICRNDEETDITVYSFNKIVGLLKNINPNVIELLGNKPEHYFYVSESGKLLLDNAHVFLTKKAVAPFFGYAHQQLHRLENKAVREKSDVEVNEYLIKKLNSLNIKGYNFYMDNGKVYVDIDNKHIPIDVVNQKMEDVKKVYNEYTTLGMRNKKAIEHDKLGKHMMHLVRLYMMCYDILAKGEIITNRSNEREFLLSIRNGKFLKDNKTIMPEFYDLIKSWEDKVEYAVKHTNLPPCLDDVRLKYIDEMVRYVHYKEIERNKGYYVKGMEV